MNYARQIDDGGFGPGTADRLNVVFSEVYERGFNTNYAVSWFVVRSGVRLDGSGNLDPAGSGCGTDVDSLHVTLGPMTTKQIDSARVPAYTIPLL
ncbi:MAG: hypothetical protein R3C05_26550 [Pirellulaceae bacterium]